MTDTTTQPATTDAVAEIYPDARGEHWRPAGSSDYDRNWLWCEETNRGVRYRPSVEREFGPLTLVTL